MSGAWHLDWLDLEAQAWVHTRGKGISVALLDSGVAAVGDLRGPGLTRLTFSGRPGVARDRSPSGHGTAVMGLMASAQRGVVGVAPDASYTVIDVYGAVGAPVAFRVAAGFKVAVERGADVICCPFTLPRLGGGVLEAVQTALEAGVVVVVASGNEPARASAFPERVEGVVSVAAVRSDGSLMPQSRIGPWTTIAAPGMRMSTWTTRDTVGTSFRGTSAAAPILAGVAAVALARALDLGGESMRAQIGRSFPARLRASSRPLTQRGARSGQVGGVDVGALFASLEDET